MEECIRLFRFNDNGIGGSMAPFREVLLHSNMKKVSSILARLHLCRLVSYFPLSELQFTNPKLFFFFFKFFFSFFLFFFFFANTGFLALLEQL
jgi:hypothetical protein